MELGIDEALQQGVAAHKAGNLNEADKFYTAILKVQPQHPDANHKMGVLAVSIGKVREALSFLKTALEANPATEQFWLSYIDALIKLERLNDAREHLKRGRESGLQGKKVDQLDRERNKFLETASELKENFIEEEKQLTAAIREGLRNKVKDHNDKYGDKPGKRVNLRMLGAVFRRGVGAYRTNPQSVRPSVRSEEQWAYARVNAFLYAVRRGRFRSGQFDRDLLPSGHPLKT